MDNQEEKYALPRKLFWGTISFIKKTIKYLDLHSTSIVAIATFFLAVYAYQSNSNFKNAEYLQDRPYLYFPNTASNPAPNLSSSGDREMINYTLENSGNTPAYDLHVNVSLISGSDTVASLPDNSVISLIAPGETRTNIDILSSSPQFVQELIENSSTEIQIKVHFSDYEEKQHDHILTLAQMTRTELAPGKVHIGLATIMETEN